MAILTVRAIVGMMLTDRSGVVRLVMLCRQWTIVYHDMSICLSPWLKVFGAAAHGQIKQTAIALGAMHSSAAQSRAGLFGAAAGRLSDSQRASKASKAQGTGQRTGQHKTRHQPGRPAL